MIHSSCCLLQNPIPKEMSCTSWFCKTELGLFKAILQKWLLCVSGKRFARISIVLLALKQEESQITRLYAKAILQMRREMRHALKAINRHVNASLNLSPSWSPEQRRMARITRMTLETLLGAVNQHISPTGWSSPHLGRPRRGQGWKAYQAGGTVLSTKLLHS